MDSLQRIQRGRLSDKIYTTIKEVMDTPIYRFTPGMSRHDQEELMHELVYGVNHVKKAAKIQSYVYFTNLVEEDAPFYVKVLAPYYDMLYQDRPFTMTHEQFIAYRLRPHNRFPWAIEPRNDWEWRALLYFKQRVEDKKKIQALKKLFSELEGEFE